MMSTAEIMAIQLINTGGRQMYTRETAAEQYGIEIDGDEIRYYDDATQAYYVGDAQDLDILADLLNNDNEDVAADAYSHWCAATGHDIAQ